MLRPATFLAALAALAAVPLARAATVTVDDLTLLADTPGQEIVINVMGGDLVAGVDLFAELIPNDDDVETVTFEGVDLLTGTIFAEDDAAVQTDAVLEPTRLYSIVDSSNGSPADGVLATLVVSTVGVSDASFELRLTGVAGTADTQLFGPGGSAVETTVIEGVITVAPVPEPAAVALLAGAPLLLRRRRVA